MTAVYLSVLGVILGRACEAAAGRWPAAVPPRVRPAAPARNRAVAVVIAGLGLASCGTTVSTTVTDAFKQKPTTTLMLIESNPAGATAKTSMGQTCKTPCTMLISIGNDFTVTFTLDGYVPQTLPVHATMSAGGWTTAPSPVLDPGSLFPTLEPVKPPPTGARRAKTASRPAAAGEGTQR
jgi:hypothetical protein